MSAAGMSRGNPPTRPRRGGIGKRRSGRGGRADKDGDLMMDVAVAGRGGGISKTSRNVTSMGRGEGRPGRATLDKTAFQKAMLRHVGDMVPRAPRSTPERSTPVEIKITGWTNSKTATSANGVPTALLAWLEKKASRRLGSKRRTVRIMKSHIDGHELIIKIDAQDAASITSMNGFEYGPEKVKLHIESVGGAVHTPLESTATAEQIKATLRGILDRRYTPDTKLLDLSALGQDPELQARGFFEKETTSKKFFPAMMTVLSQQFETQKELDETITSVSLASNDLKDLTEVETLSKFLPQLKNLDLSNNKLEKLSTLHVWHRRFRKLEHLVLTNNPMEQADPIYHEEALKIWQSLRFLNGIQVRTEEEIASRTQLDPSNLPFPIRSPQFRDEGQIAENFIRTFFTGFDSDRAALAAHYFDDQSDFSYAVNTMAPRDPVATEKVEPNEWDTYIKKSRNLTKISQLSARMNRHYLGTKAVQEAWQSMPKTTHPDLAAEARKWMIECHIQPGVPDPTGQSPNGVDGFLVTVHGEFEELDASSGQPKKKRSFDRTFVIGPGGPSGVRVVNDMLTIRAHGGNQAFEPDQFEDWIAPDGRVVPPAASTGAAAAAVSELPAGMTLEVAEKMVLQLQQQTGMHVQFAKDCLEQSGWDLGRAAETFTQVKAQLPADAFVQ